VREPRRERAGGGGGGPIGVASGVNLMKPFRP
jgi:hypothetical protein